MLRMMLSILAASPILTGAAAAQNWPTRPLMLIIPFAPGGGVDASARIQAQYLSELLGQPIVAENMGAAAGMVGSARVAKAEPDGHTFLIGNTGTHAYNQSLYKKLLYNAMGVEITHIPYRGAGPAMQDLIAGRIDYMCDTIQTGAVQAKARTVKGIAVMAPKRVAIIADLATSGEQGLAGVEASVWNAFFFPKGTPDAIVRRMSKAVNDMLENPVLRKRLEDLGLEIVPPERRGPEYLAKFLPEEIERWGKVIRAAGISAE